MGELVRFSVSIEKPLYRHMGKLLEKSGYANRSEFITQAKGSRNEPVKTGKDRSFVTGTSQRIYRKYLTDGRGFL